ncbi:MAG TPA: hypothetical protein VGN39_03375 [Terriglobales bacterium]|jgi:hypothetical protein|nr:hypothetical protein [Terriglobales bacterium]
MSISVKLTYGARWLPNYLWQRMHRNANSRPVHLIIALADHFEPSVLPHQGASPVPLEMQERKLETWCQDYPQAVTQWRDAEGYPLRHTYFYPAEQYHKDLIDRLAQHCSAGWGEIEIHLHHGIGTPDSSENVRRQLLEFRDALATQHGSLCYMDGHGSPRYAFVHGNFALANSARDINCGVDSEIQVLAETGCYADLTLPTAPFHPGQVGKINSLYECSLPLNTRAAHRRGRDLERGRTPKIFPLMVQGPLLPDFHPKGRRWLSIENGALTKPNPPSLHRLRLWKRAAVRVEGCPDWLFIKLHCHSMDSTQEDAVLGSSMQHFLRELVEGAPQRDETIHFVTAREMVNIVLAACDGREGNPGDYREYRLKRNVATSSSAAENKSSQALVRG